MNREMKDSGVEWIGEVPEYWSVTRLKYAYDNSNGSAVRVGPFGSALPSSDYISDGEWIYNQRTVLDENFTTNNTCVSKEKADSLSGFRVYPGDILITTRGTLGRIAIVPNGAPSGILHPCIIRFRVDSNIVMPELLKYMFNDSDFFIKQIEFTNNSTTIEALYSYNLRDLILPAIPITEQQQIVHFLDRKCTAIDTAIEKTKKSIEKLEEYKKAVITKAVTKGIDPNAKMKDSGVEWIGEIPEGWEVKQLRTYFSRRINKNIYLQESNLLSLSYGHIVRKNIDTKEGLLPESFDGYNIVEDGDIVIRGTDLQNDHRSLRTGLVTERGIITSAYITLKPKEDVNSAYYHYLLHCYDISKVFYSMGGGLRQSLDYWEFIRIPVLHPTDREQEEIISYIKTKCTAIDATIEKKKKAIEKWEEYKKSLIYYAVTGKIDCRNEVI